jgi:hypothetical protein
MIDAVLWRAIIKEQMGKAGSKGERRKQRTLLIFYINLCLYLIFGNRKTANIVELVMVQHNLDARRR